MGQLETSTDLKEDVTEFVQIGFHRMSLCGRWIQEIQGKESPPEGRSSCSAELPRTELWIWIHLSVGTKAHPGCARANLGVLTGKRSEKITGLPRRENISNPSDGHISEELDKRTQKRLLAKSLSSKEVSSSLIPQNLNLFLLNIPII